MASITVKELPTPEENPDAYNIIIIAGQPCPGLCLPIDGEKKRAVGHSKDKGASKDLLVDNGIDLTEATIRIKTWDGDTYRKLYQFYLQYMSPDRALSRLNVVSVANAYFYARGIKSGYFYSAPIPKPTAETGIRPMISSFTMKIIGPNTQITGLSSSTKPKLASAPANASKWQFNFNTVNAVSYLATTDLLDFTKKGTPLPDTLFPNEVPVPPGQELTLFTPGQQQQLAAAGSPTAAFNQSMLDKATPSR